MKSNTLQDTNWKNISQQDYNVAILPWGATEAHNYHLPYGTDTYLAERISRDSSEIANKLGASSIVLPSIAYGVNSGQMEVKFCMNINPSTQKLILEDILQVLSKHGIKKLIILNAHGGNQFQPIIRELSISYPETIICSINWWIVCKGDNYFTEQGDHAGELETSCMQAIHPELVLPLVLAGNGDSKELKFDGFKEKWAWTPRRWIYVSKDTGVGNPSASNPEKGSKFIHDCCIKIADFIVEFDKIKKEEDLYEQW